MEQFVEFAGNHQLLVTAFIILSSALIWNLVTDPAGKNALGPAEATGLINHQDALVLDVRTATEFKQGHIVNAVNIPLGDLNGQLEKLQKHKDRQILVACRSGSRSGVATRSLQKAGFEHAHNLRGGMLAWENASLPISRKS